MIKGNISYNIFDVVIVVDIIIVFAFVIIVIVELKNVLFDVVIVSH